MIRIAVKKERRASTAEALADLSLANDPLLSTAKAAAMLGLSQKTLREYRCDRRGPRCFKLGTKKQARTVYRLSDLDRWVRENAHAAGGA
jgi:predicted DNA-binding transcriptional regulator AlpA